MSEIIRNLVSGKPMSRREFLQKTGAAAALGAMNKVPPIGPLPSPKMAVPQGLDPRSILPPAFESGFSMPRTGETIQMLDGDAVLWGGDFYGGMTKEQMIANKAILERARQSMPDAKGRPMSFNHLTNQWHDQALRHPVGPDGVPETWQQVHLKAGIETPDAHHLSKTEHYLWEDIAASANESGTLTAGAYGGRGPNLVDGYEDAWWNERQGVLNDTLQQSGGDAKQMAKSEDGRMLLKEKGLTPGGRYSAPPSMQSEANAMGGMQGTPGENHKETVGRIRRLLGVAAPVMAAGAAAQQEQQK